VCISKKLFVSIIIKDIFVVNYVSGYMPSDKQKITVAVLLLVSFLSYSFYIYTSLPVKESPVSNKASDGKQLWQQYNCNACHQVYGLGGYLGPDLTNVYSKRGANYISSFLKSGTAIMPNFHLSDSEIESLTAYLQNIDSSGKADPRTFKIHFDGTIEQ